MTLTVEQVNRKSNFKIREDRTKKERNSVPIQFNQEKRELECIDFPLSWISASFAPAL